MIKFEPSPNDDSGDQPKMTEKPIILRGSLPSPFVRKVRLAAEILSISDQIVFEFADTTDLSGSLVSQNPLGKIPSLVLPDGQVLYDSAVINDYLNAFAHGSLIPVDMSRFDVLTREALADGIMEAALLQVYEVRFRPEERRHAEWIAMQSVKVDRGLDWLEAHVPTNPSQPDKADIATACMLGYLDMRFEGAWRKGYPGMLAWLETFDASVPGFAKTAPPPA